MTFDEGTSPIVYPRTGEVLTGAAAQAHRQKNAGGRRAMLSKAYTRGYVDCAAANAAAMQSIFDELRGEIRSLKSEIKQQAAQLKRLQGVRV